MIRRDFLTWLASLPFVPSLLGDFKDVSEPATIPPTAERADIRAIELENHYEPSPEAPTLLRCTGRIACYDDAGNLVAVGPVVTLATMPVMTCPP